MPKRKMTDNDIQIITQKTKDRSTPLITGDEIVFPRKSNRHPLLHMWHPSCYPSYKPSDKSYMRKEPDCDYDKQYISGDL